MSNPFGDVIVGFSLRPEDSLLLRQARPLAMRVNTDLLALIEEAGVAVGQGGPTAASAVDTSNAEEGVSISQLLGDNE